jgi:hypothetical protein
MELPLKRRNGDRIEESLSSLGRMLTPVLVPFSVMAVLRGSL